MNKQEKRTPTIKNLQLERQLETRNLKKKNKTINKLDKKKEWDKLIKEEKTKIKNKFQNTTQNVNKNKLNRDITAVFWDTHGKIKYNIENDFLNYETSMSINWNNKTARKVLINLLQLFNRPNILYLEPNGIAIWDNNVLKDTLFYNVPILFYEISIRDKYVIKQNNKYNTEYPFLECKYDIELNQNYKKLLSKLYNYINYDSYIKHIVVKSRTLEENLIILDLFLKNNINNHLDLINKKNNIMKQFDKLNNIDYKNKMKTLIENINNHLSKNDLYSIKNLNYE